jgi:hypothetical protein
MTKPSLMTGVKLMLPRGFSGMGVWVGVGGMVVAEGSGVTVGGADADSLAAVGAVVAVLLAVAVGGTAVAVWTATMGGVTAVGSAAQAANSRSKIEKVSR